MLPFEYDYKGEKLVLNSIVQLNGIISRWARNQDECSSRNKSIGEMRLLEFNQPNQSTNSTIIKGETTMSQNEVNELLKKIDEYKQLIEDAENALDATIEELEELLAELDEDEEDPVEVEE